MFGHRIKRRVIALLLLYLATLGIVAASPAFSPMADHIECHGAASGAHAAPHSDDHDDHDDPASCTPGCELACLMSAGFGPAPSSPQVGIPAPHELSCLPVSLDTPRASAPAYSKPPARAPPVPA